MTDLADMAASAGSADPRVGLRAAMALRRLADALEVTKQAVHKKHAPRMRED